MSAATERVGGLRRQVGAWTLRVERVPGLPLTSIRTWTLAGSRLEPLPGLSLVTGRMLSEGTRGRDWSRWATDVEDRGMTLRSTGSFETIGVGLDALAEDGALAVDWLAEILLEPAFPEERLLWIRRQAAAELEGMLDQPDYRAARAFLHQLYHPHPYGRALQGSRESLEQITSEGCRAFFERALGWGGCLVVIGDVDEQAVVERLETLLGSRLGSESTSQPAVPEIEGAPDLRQELVVGGRDQAHLFLGRLTVPRAHPDRLALDLAAVILGAGPGMSGRLPYRIREREGLAYAVDIHLTSGAGLDPGRSAVYVGTAPGRLEQAERAVREELTRALEDGFTDPELEEARSYLVGREPFRHETLRQRADRITETELYGLPADRPEWIVERLHELDREQVEAALRRWVRVEDLRVTVGLPKG